MIRSSRSSFTGSGHRVAEQRGGRAFAGIVAVGERLVEPRPLHQREGEADVLLGLPGEPGQNIGRDRDSREGARGGRRRAGGSRRPCTRGSSPRAPGPTRSARAGARAGTGAVRAAMTATRSGERSFGCEVRYRIQRMRPAAAATRSRSRGKRDRRAALRVPVGVHVLSEQRDVEAAVGLERPHLREHLRDGSRNLGTAHVRDDAVGAEVVAPVHDRQVRAGTAAASGAPRTGRCRPRRPAAALPRLPCGPLPAALPCRTCRRRRRSRGTRRAHAARAVRPCNR